MLGNLKEIYQKFKETFPNIKIGFSKFASMRPKNCIFAGSTGTHSICVCTIHQNVKLMIEGCGIRNLTKNRDVYLSTYKDCLTFIMCKPPTTDCHLGNCADCPGSSELQQLLHAIFEESEIETITYKQWTSTDRSSLETRVESSDDFVDNFVSKLTTLRRHAFIAKQQGNYLKTLKTSIKPAEFIVLLDFSENYSFVLQDEVQGYHWNNAQCTIHPFGIYFVTAGQQLQHLNLIAISDCLQHDTILVHLFQRKLVQHLKEKFEKVERIYYFSDGCSAQYKNRKNFANVTMHSEDFVCPAEWHFFATSHGKSVCDGLGGTLKRLAAKASLQRPYNEQIMTPRQLYEWAKEIIKNIDFVFVPSEEYYIEEKLLKDRFQSARQIKGTQKIHAVIPTSEGLFKAKFFSTSTEEFTYVAMPERAENASVSEPARGFVTFVKDGAWWLGCIISENDDTSEVKINTLLPSGPSNRFQYPEKPLLNIVNSSSILVKVDPKINKKKQYTLTKSQIDTVVKKYKDLGL